MTATGLEVSFQGGFFLEGSVDWNFPLFTPEGETLWAEGWEYEWILARSNRSEEGALFRTKDVRGREMVWRILRFEPPHRAVYYVVTTASHVTEVRVSLEAKDAGTYVSVQYVYVPFTPDGREFIAAITEETYRERMEHWKHSIEKMRANHGETEHTEAVHRD